MQLHKIKKYIQSLLMKVLRGPPVRETPYILALQNALRHQVGWLLWVNDGSMGRSVAVLPVLLMAFRAAAPSCERIDWAWASWLATCTINIFLHEGGCLSCTAV